MRIAASILDSDFLHLGLEIKKAERAGVDLFHLDVMDGHFVPNLSFGVPVVRSLRSATRLPLATHLMVQEPEALIEPFARAGSDMLVFHIEATKQPERCLRLIRSSGARAGIALNPGTPVERVRPFLKKIDLLLLMSVWPGFGGQRFIRATFPRLRTARALIETINPRCLLAVDGGVKSGLAPALAEAGVDIAVVGSALFHARRYAPVVRALHGSDR